MDLRTKLVLILVTFSLVSMAALGLFAHGAVEDLLTRSALRQLDAMAESKRDDLENVLDGWRDRVSLVASRTQLRLSLERLLSGDDPEERSRIERILSDARGASETVRSLAVHDARGRLVARVGSETPPPTVPPDPIRLDAAETVTYRGVAFADGEPLVEFRAPLVLDGVRMGFLDAVLATRDLVEMTRTFTGLGETGETTIGLRDSTGEVRMLHPLRFPTADSAIRTAAAEETPLERALRGERGPFDRGLSDYRGEDVWAATRLLPDLGWGLVVKIDAAEQSASMREFRDRLVWVGFSLSGLAILVGILLGLHLARPIHDLAEVANRLREGDLEARAQIHTEDELGLLARTFDEMAEEMERRMTLLQEYKTFFELSPDMLCVAGTDGYFKRVNPAFERTLGWSSEELLARPFVGFVHPDDVEDTLRETEKLGRGIPTVQFENRYRLPDGGYARLSWTCHPDPDSGLLYAIARRIRDDEASP